MRKLAALFVLLSVCSAPVTAQQLTSQQIEQLRQNPEVIRDQIAASGLTPEQIRQRLQAAGYPPSLLDQYLGEETAGAPAPAISVETLSALAALGIEPVSAEGLVAVPTVIGPQPVDTAEVVDTLEVEELPLFGADVFRRSPTLFQPDLAGPVPPTYRLGPGDEMVLVLTGDVEILRELQVTREGYIIVPDVGQLGVNNLTMEQFRTLLRQRLANSYSGIRTGTTRFDVTITRTRTNQVFVTGEVLQPGAYRLSSLATVLNALYAAGGLTERANFRNIAVRRGGEIAAQYDFYDFLLGGDTRNDIMLRQGDVVYVPTQGVRASVVGAVVRPAIYELAAGETLRDLIQAAGGFRADAALQRISVSRIVPPAQRTPDGPQRVVVDVPLTQVTEGMAPPFGIAAGDSVTVFSVTEARRSFVELKGAVVQPGTYGWRPGMRFRELVDLAGGFLPAVYAGRAHVERLNPVDSTRYLVTIELPPDSLSLFPSDPELRDYDIITVYSRAEFRQDRLVSIGGMVNEPGPFPYRAGMTLRDLVLMAKGLRDGAYLDTAEVARLPADRTGGTLAVTFKVPMDSTYLFEPDSTTYPFLPGLPAPGRGAPEFMLAAYDQVTILTQPDFELQRTVHVTGQVRFPGPRSLTRKDERVSNLIQRAGGLLPTAYPEGARFFRVQEGTGQVNLNLVEALDHPNEGHDLVLQPGDSLHVPEYLPTVRVSGAVNTPTSVVFRSGAGLDYYIANAGGYARLADKGRVNVRYANGSARVKQSFLFFRTAPKPGPGSTVFVPSKDPEDRVNWQAIVGSAAQILAAATTIIVVLSR